MITLTSNLLSELRHKHSRLPDYLVNSVMICEIANNSPAYRWALPQWCQYISDWELFLDYLVTCRGGLQPGDIISEINGRKTEGVRSIYDVLRSDISKPINLKIYRRDMFFNITLVPDTLQWDIALQRKWKMQFTKKMFAVNSSNWKTKKKLKNMQVKTSPKIEMVEIDY